MNFRTDRFQSMMRDASVRGEEVIFARGFGVAGIESKTPVTLDTPFLIASATMAFTLQPATESGRGK